MTNSQDISWKRISIEAAAIVASILFAFAIDAWWQDRQEEISDNTHLATVVKELRTHEILLGEAISAHQKTLVAGATLLRGFSLDSSVEGASRSPQTFSELMNFYQINAPFGALETAMSSGAIPRMRNTELSSAIANWPIAIDDLLEEQRQGYALMFSLFSEMSELTPMSDVYRAKLLAPTIRGTSEVVDMHIDELTPSPFQFDSNAVFSSHKIENELLLLMALAQSAVGEATSFEAQLRTLIERLESCLGASNC